MATKAEKWREFLRLRGGVLPRLAGADPITDTPEGEAIEALTRSVAELRTAIEERDSDPLSEEKVAQIAEEVLARSAEHTQAVQRRSYTPAEGEEQAAERGLQGDHVTRMTQIHARDARLVAPMLSRSAEEVRDFQVRADNLTLLAAIMHSRAADGGQRIDVRETRYYSEQYLPALRAMDTQTAAEGLEFIPRLLSNQLIERVTLDLQVLPLFSSIEMPSNPFDIPGRAVSRQRGGLGVENTADTGQTAAKKLTPGTRKVTLTAKKFWGEALVSKEAEEDSIIALLPFMQEELVDYLSFDLEDTAVNGDTAGTHQDSDVTAADDPRKNWVGLRKSALAAAKTDGSNAALQASHLLTNRKKMGKYGVRVSDLCHIISIAGLTQLMTDPSVQTLEKYGPAATILTGEIGKVHGAPVIVSEAVRMDTNATGVYDGTTTNRALALTVNRKGWVVGERRGLTVQVLRELYAEDDQDAVLATQRKAFAARFPTATEAIVAETYNLAS